MRKRGTLLLFCLLSESKGISRNLTITPRSSWSLSHPPANSSFHFLIEGKGGIRECPRELTGLRVLTPMSTEKMMSNGDDRSQKSGVPWTGRPKFQHCKPKVIKHFPFPAFPPMVMSITKLRHSCWCCSDVECRVKLPSTLLRAQATLEVLTSWHFALTTLTPPEPAKPRYAKKG